MSGQTRAVATPTATVVNGVRTLGFRCTRVADDIYKQ